MTKVVNIHAAKTHLSRLIARAASGEEIIIARNGQPVARLVSLESRPARRVAGLFKGKIEISEGFDDELDQVDEIIIAPDMGKLVGQGGA